MVNIDQVSKLRIDLIDQVSDSAMIYIDQQGGPYDLLAIGTQFLLWKYVCAKPVCDSPSLAAFG